MLLLNSFLIVSCYETFIYLLSLLLWDIYLNYAKHTSYIIFFHLKHFQSETDREPKEEKSRKKHKVKHVGISNSLM